jgi:hypothetical protein
VPRLLGLVHAWERTSKSSLGYQEARERKHSIKTLTNEARLWGYTATRTDAAPDNTITFNGDVADLPFIFPRRDDDVRPTWSA